MDRKTLPFYITAELVLIIGFSGKNLKNILFFIFMLPPGIQVNVLNRCAYWGYVLSDYLTPDLGWLGRVGRGTRDSRHSPIRVGTGGFENQVITIDISDQTNTNQTCRDVVS